MKRALSVFLAVLFLTAIFTVPANARASNQIAGYSVTVTPLGSGSIRVVVSVSGTHNQMTRIGFPSITLYERNNSNSSWGIVRVEGARYNPNSLAGSHSYSFIYQGVAGRQYYAGSQFFARDSLGSDTRSASSPTVTAS